MLQALAERVEREKAEKAEEKSSPKASPILSARQPASAAGEKAAEGSASVLAASPTETGNLDTRLSPSTEGAAKQKNVPGSASLHTINCDCCVVQPKGDAQWGPRLHQLLHPTINRQL